MKGKTGQDIKQPRKPYIKPEVRQVQLKPEEAVLGGCKIAGQFGPALSNCSLPPACSVILS